MNITKERLRHVFASKKEIKPIAVAGNRVLVLGSRIKGSYRMADGFQKYLEGRNIPKPSVEVLRDVSTIEIAVLGQKTIEEGRKKPNLPKGVILLPEMRQYTPEGSGMTVDVYKTNVCTSVEQLCKKLNIPLIKILEYLSPEQIENGLKKFLEESNQSTD